MTVNTFKNNLGASATPNASGLIDRLKSGGAPAPHAGGLFDLIARSATVGAPGGNTAAAPAQSQRDVSNEPDPFRPADPTEGIDPATEDAILVGDGIARIVASGGVDRKCYRRGDTSYCELRYDPDSEPTGRVSIQRSVRGGRYITFHSAEAPEGGKAICRASKDNPELWVCEEIRGPNSPPEEPPKIIIEEIL